MSDAVTRLNAALEGRYRIESELGEGGMATVYLADDLKHERKVALKVLKPELAAVVGAERFLAEIKTTANLQHPHILPLFDSGEADSFLFYVMPYVEGESLRQRLDREHQLPVDDAVQIAKNVAEALDYAHRQGVIHRDIKPANILLQDGKPVISDFGIALAVGTAGQGHLTETGLSLGTPLYMSPEQATGDQTVGAATDIYALGCVLYEMLVGEPPYTGSTAQAILGKIIAGKLASATEHRTSVPANVDAAIRKALEKLPADRFTDARDIGKALTDSGFRHGEMVGAVAAAPQGPWNRLTLTFAALFVLAAGGWGWALLRPGPPTPVIRYPLVFPHGEELRGGRIRPSVALSPDGEKLLYVGPVGEDGNWRLWVRQRNELRATELYGSEGANTPFFSPDGTRFGFVRGNRGQPSLMVKSLVGGAPQVLLDSGVGLDGGSWGADDFIYYDGLTGGGTRGIMRLPATGGTPQQVTAVDTARGETDHVWPHILPGARGLLFTVIRNNDLTDADIATSEVGSGDHQILTRGVTAKYATSGQLLYVSNGGTLFAAPFDATRLELKGEAIEIASGLSVRGSGAVDLALSNTSRMAYLTGSVSPRLAEMVWVDRSGNQEAIDPDWVENFTSSSLSPDGSQLAVTAWLLASAGQSHVTVKTLPQGPALRLTSATNRNDRPIWSPDGQSVLFRTIRDGTSGIYSRRADGSASAIPVLTGAASYHAAKYSPDGRWLIYNEEGELYARRTGMEAEPLALGVFPANRGAGSISPNGRWLAYTEVASNDSGDFDVYIVPFPNTADSRSRVSTEGGISPNWSRSGRELFYVTPDRELVSVEVEDGASFSTGERQVLFTLDPPLICCRYDIAVADDRFLMKGRSPSSLELELIVVENWFEELRQRVPN